LTFIEASLAHEAARSPLCNLHNHLLVRREGGSDERGWNLRLSVIVGVIFFAFAVAAVVVILAIWGMSHITT
jgi:hypothetical protein